MINLIVLDSCPVIEGDEYMKELPDEGSEITLNMKLHAETGRRSIISDFLEDVCAP